MKKNDDLKFLKSGKFCFVNHVVKRLRQYITSQKKIYSRDGSGKELLPKNIQETVKTQQ